MHATAPSAPIGSQLEPVSWPPAQAAVAAPAAVAAAPGGYWQPPVQRYPTGAWGRSTIYRFDGGAATYIGTALLATLITIITLGICFPFALVLFQRWRAKHTLLLGYRLKFTGMATHLFGLWLKWLLLIIVTFGIYSFWVTPRVFKWVAEHTDIDPDVAPQPLI